MIVEALIQSSTVRHAGARVNYTTVQTLSILLIIERDFQAHHKIKQIPTWDELEHIRTKWSTPDPGRTIGEPEPRITL